MRIFRCDRCLKVGKPDDEAAAAVELTIAPEYETAHPQVHRYELCNPCYREVKDVLLNSQVR